MSLPMVLRTTPLFRSLEGDELERLSAVGRIESWGQDRRVFGEGEEADNVYVVLTGRVKIWRRDIQGEAIELSTVAAGDIFGEMSVFDGAPRSATATTVEACEFFIIRREDFLECVIKSPHLIPSMLAEMSRRIRDINDKIMSQEVEKQRVLTEMERQRHRSLARMIAGVAHELNTPLGIVNTAASFLEDNLTTDLLSGQAQNAEGGTTVADIVEVTRLIQANLSRVNRLVESFKSLSVSQLIESKEDVDLLALIESIVALYKPQARKARLEVQIKDELGPGSREWRGYGGYLSQILLNLLSNIERYAYPDGAGGTVEIVVASEDGPGEPCFVVSVRDFGRGMTPEVLAKAFEPFTTGRGRGGTGLGLTIVHHLTTTMLKGTVSLKSEPLRGTVVTLRFPRVIPDEVEDEVSNDGAVGER
jgi:signal transduction histidine kinase